MDSKKLPRICKTCDKSYTTYRSTNKFCSKKCYGLSTLGRKRDPSIGLKISKGLTGKKLSEQHRLSISKAHIGLKQTPEHIEKRIAQLRKENHWNWKGGATPDDKLQRNKFARFVFKKVLERDDYTCQLCGERGGILTVDHIQSWVEYVELRFSMDNCRALCKGCHYKITFGKPMPEKSSWIKKGRFIRTS